MRAELRDRTLALQAWCAPVAANLERFTFDERRLVLEALGIRVTASCRAGQIHSELAPAGESSPGPDMAVGR